MDHFIFELIKIPSLLQNFTGYLKNIPQNILRASLIDLISWYNLNNIDLNNLQIILDRIDNINFGSNYIYTKYDDLNSKININPLLLACYQKKFPIIKFLVENKIDINYIGKNNMTPIFLCFQNGDIESFIYLKNKGAKLWTDTNYIGDFPPQPRELTKFINILVDIMEGNKKKIIISGNKKINALYGSEDNYLDITDKLLKLSDNNKIIIPTNLNFDKYFGNPGDNLILEISD